MAEEEYEVFFAFPEEKALATAAAAADGAFFLGGVFAFTLAASAFPAEDTMLFLGDAPAFTLAASFFAAAAVIGDGIISSLLGCLKRIITQWFV